MAFRIADNHAVCDTCPSFSLHLAYPETVTQKIGQKLRDSIKATRFLVQIRLREPFGIARAACFERMAGVFAIRAAPPNTTAT